MGLFSTLLSPMFWPKIQVLCVFGRNRVSGFDARGGYGYTDAFSKFHFLGSWDSKMNILKTIQNRFLTI